MLWRSPSWRLVLAFVGLVLVYAGFASQGGLPLLSPDETAVAALSQRLFSGEGLSLVEPRAAQWSWLHPRSFVVQGERLLPVGFPLWTALLGLVGWMGVWASLWVAVLVCASALIPSVWLLEERGVFSRGRAIAIALSALCMPMAVLYGNRAFFTLLPQIALILWSIWLIQSHHQKPFWQWLAGVGCAVAVGLRPTEGIWLVPWIGYGYFLKPHWPRRIWMAHVGGCVMGVAAILGLHAWVYGSPWIIGYWLKSGGDGAGRPSDIAMLAPATRVAVIRKLFPYGTSLSHLRLNGVAAARLGLWPWMVAWVGVAGVVLVHWKALLRERQQWYLFAILIWTMAWLVFYYGQGSYADHIGGQMMHLGNSFLRYLAPAMMVWTAYAAAQALRRWRVGVPAAVVLGVIWVSIGAGVAWAYQDSEDGILRGRVERRHYQEVRDFVATFSPTSTLWVSDRSDKMLVPERTAVSPMPSPSQMAEVLRVQAGPLWVYMRPPSQLDRDAWLAEGIELVERRSYKREAIFEVRLRDARQAP